MPNLSEEQWRSFSNYLGQALELSEGELAPWFATLAKAEPAIAAEVARALSARERQGFAAFLSDSPLAPEQLATSALSGRHVGPYVIESEVGRGGMGSVWRARRHRASADHNRRRWPHPQRTPVRGKAVRRR